MDAEQLRRDYLRWPKEGIPDTFLFLGLAYESNREAPYAVDRCREFLKDAIAWQRSQVDVILSSLR
jgi:hypothetical protein